MLLKPHWTDDLSDGALLGFEIHITKKYFEKALTPTLRDSLK